MDNNLEHVSRFDGLGKVYDDSRPTPPKKLIEALLQLCGKASFLFSLIIEIFIDFFTRIN